jgi:hypothetical protein
VYREGELYGTEVGTEMTTCRGHGVDDEGPDLVAQLVKLFARESFDVSGRLDALEEGRD